MGYPVLNINRIRNATGISNGLSKPSTFTVFITKMRHYGVYFMSETEEVAVRGRIMTDYSNAKRRLGRAPRRSRARR